MKRPLKKAQSLYLSGGTGACCILLALFFLEEETVNKKSKLTI
jgi:hypothetical protein